MEDGLINSNASASTNGAVKSDRVANVDLPNAKFDTILLKQKSRAEVSQEVLKGKSVLLVEDSWLIAQGYKSMLELAGMQVLGPAASVADAEEYLRLAAPDFALVDINLEDGGESYGLIEVMVARRIPVVIISGNIVSKDVAASVDCVLMKPVGGATLMATLRRVGAIHHYG